MTTVEAYLEVLKNYQYKYQRSVLWNDPDLDENKPQFNTYYPSAGKY